MNNQNTTAPSGAGSARARLEEITSLYEGMRDLLVGRIEDARADDSLPAKALITRLTDLQTAQLLLMKAEEKFHDTFEANDGAEDTGNIEALRIEIGRKLDRLRDSVATADVSQQSDG